ncbi:NUDIX domain-containing protein [Photobacterium sp. WH77]|uniref:8-oxo-dGTP diphosphatase n=1 Tax=Photobacterium arenosum TaxID=2774143 RepID=A0ABR9BND6_9GAMM|nr:MULTISPECIES: NUDIX domain-containing protein [Photobacterium]MBD8514080.1 NUDIX domain-containing protein [Photobacterium arenosum]MBV7264423.1 NUDIX domain-containing protein [Photobacterium sp. WH24]MCG2837474.1 NUDIX domain-containing protein [Photobacterium sp. WH77]MCG2844956.1 NUDIX domain-containing protein [Photobacterium sp. WH80]MDO6582289.1 NUDIX domain-containing protein [Photobacterium sp. 2_MG-2023]
MQREVHDCVSFLLIRGEEVLLEQRKLSKVVDPGLMAIPGGHVEAGESLEQALIREVAEELTVTPIAYFPLCTLYHPTTELQRLHYYVVTDWTGELSAQEAEAVIWTSLHEPNAATVEADNIALAEYRRVILPLLKERR